MIRETNMASAVGAKTARACDICVKKRARWYCAADDAFLCQSCDDSVHSANPLAKRHERVRIKSGSMVTRSSEAACLPTWHRGPTKKLRTPRHGRKKKHHSNKNNHLVVPELDASTSMDDEQEEEQLLYRVPVYEYDLDHHYPASCEVLLSDFDLADFDADVEAILGKGLDGDQNCGIEELGLLMDSHGQRDDYFVKVEKEEDRVEEIEVLREPFELSFDYDSPFACDDGDVKVVVNTGIHQEKKMILNLDYDSISMAWGTQGSPWMNGKRPDFNPNDDRWPLSTTGDCVTDTKGYGEVGLIIGAARGDKGGREARVSRYREKRRTRLFSKKIRYEVRKLNAEKRPRMKGRFVKRSSLIAK